MSGHDDHIDFFIAGVSDDFDKRLAGDDGGDGSMAIVEVFGDEIFHLFSGDVEHLVYVRSHGQSFGSHGEPILVGFIQYVQDMELSLELFGKGFGIFQGDEG